METKTSEQSNGVQTWEHLARLPLCRWQFQAGTVCVENLETVASVWHTQPCESDALAAYLPEKIFRLMILGTHQLSEVLHRKLDVLPGPGRKQVSSLKADIQETVFLQRMVPWCKKWALLLPLG